MKKLFFTAIAIIAFSIVSNANTIADETNVEKKEVASNEQKEEKPTFLILTGCDILYIKSFVAAINENFTETQAGVIANGTDQACITVEAGKGQ